MENPCAFLLELKGHQGQDFAIEFELCYQNYMYILLGSLFIMFKRSVPI